VNPSTLVRIQAFTHNVLRPAYADITKLLEDPEHRIVIASSPTTGDNAADLLLQQMHLGKSYLAQRIGNFFNFEEPSFAPQSWIGDSLYIEVIEYLETDPVRKGQYCLSVEFRITPAATDRIQVGFIVGHTPARDATLHIQNQSAEDTLRLQNIEETLSADILLSFQKSFNAFETQLPESERTLEEAPAPPALEPDLAHQPDEPNLTQPVLDLETPPAPSEIAPEPTTPTPDPPVQPAAPILTPQQQLYALKLKAIELSQQLAPSPHNPLSCKLNSELTQPARIVALRDQYNRIVTLCLEYSPTITEPDLTEQLQRLGHYQHLDHLANQRRFIEDRMQAWLNLYGQPSPGAIAHHLKDRIAQQSKTLYHHLYNLAESYLDTLTALALQADLEQATEEQQQEKNLLDALEQNPILGYLDAKLLEQKTPLATINPFTDEQPIALQAQFIRRKGKEPHNTVMLNHIASCQSEAYQTYRQRFPDLPALSQPFHVRWPRAETRHAASRAAVGWHSRDCPR
jgi:hypothetical protein